MSNRFLSLPVLVALLALPACSGKQTARTHVQSDEPSMALQVVDEWQALDGEFEQEFTSNSFSTLYSNDVETATDHEGDLRVAQELLELLNSGRADDAMAMIQELGLADRAGDANALLALLQGGGQRTTMPRGQDGALLKQLMGNQSLGGGLALDAYGGDEPSSSRSSTSSIDAAFSSHRAAFDKIGP